MKKNIQLIFTFVIMTLILSCTLNSSEEELKAGENTTESAQQELDILEIKTCSQYSVMLTLNQKINNLDKYAIYYSKDGVDFKRSPEDNKFTYTFSEPDNPIINIKYLKPDTKYFVKIEIYTKTKLYGTTKTIEVTTKPIRINTISVTKTDSVSFSVNAIDELTSDAYMHKLYYYTDITIKDYYTNYTGIFKIEKLTPETTYKIYTEIYNSDNNLIAKSNITEIKTLALITCVINNTDITTKSFTISAIDETITDAHKYMMYYSNDKITFKNDFNLTGIFSVTSLTYDTTYFVYSEIYDSDNNLIAKSNTIEIKTLPIQISSTDISITSFTITASNETFTDAYKYMIYYSTDSTTFKNDYNYTGTFSLKSLTADTTYFVYLEIYDSNNNILAKSNTIEIKTLPIKIQLKEGESYTIDNVTITFDYISYSYSATGIKQINAMAIAYSIENKNNSNVQYYSYNRSSANIYHQLNGTVISDDAEYPEYLTPMPFDYLTKKITYFTGDTLLANTKMNDYVLFIMNPRINAFDKLTVIMDSLFIETYNYPKIEFIIDNIDQLK